MLFKLLLSGTSAPNDNVFKNNKYMNVLCYFKMLIWLYLQMIHVVFVIQAWKYAKRFGEREFAKKYIYNFPC